jgi:hypothetical protein
MTPIEKALSQINESSMAKICFYNQQFEDLIKSLDFYNIIFAGDGMFIGTKSDFGISIDKIDSIKYTNTSLNSFKSSAAIYPFVPKPNLEVFVKIIEIFKYVYDRIKSEICVNVYYDKKTKQFITNIEQQLVTSVHVGYDYEEKFEMSKDYIRYLQIHSHHKMGANFSSVDDKDERLTSLCYYGVVGKLDEDSSFYNVDSKFRIWNGLRFVEISFDDVFNIGVSQPELNQTDLSRLDKIIRKSEDEEKKKTNLYPVTIPPNSFFKDFGNDFSPFTRQTYGELADELGPAL